jgi:hypothetical protein
MLEGVATLTKRRLKRGVCRSIVDCRPRASSPSTTVTRDLSAGPRARRKSAPHVNKGFQVLDFINRLWLDLV